MDENDREAYLYKMRYSQFLYEKNGASALRDLEEYEISRMERRWNELGEKTGRSLTALMKTLWGGMDPDFRFEIVRQTEGEAEIRCTRCPFADLSLANGMREVGFSTYCMADYGIVKGFNGDIRFERTKTLMEGDDCCNHAYFLEKKSRTGG